MDLPLINTSGCSCVRSESTGNNLPSLDDYKLNTITITYLKCPTSCNSDKTSHHSNIVGYSNLG